MKTVIWNLTTEPRVIIAEVKGIIPLSENSAFIDENDKVWRIMSGSTYLAKDKTLNYYTWEAL